MTCVFCNKPREITIVLVVAIAMLMSAVTSFTTTKLSQFGEIECTKLTIIDPADGSKRVVLDQDEHGGRVRVLSVVDPDPLPDDSLAASWGLKRVPAELRLSIFVEDKEGIAGERIRVSEGRIYFLDDFGYPQNMLILDDNNTLVCQGLHVNDPLSGKTQAFVRADQWGGTGETHLNFWV